jgi:hypothetical protein
MGPATPEEKAAVMLRSPVGMKYDRPVNRESAYEILSQKAAAREEVVKDQAKPEERGWLGNVLWGTNRRQGMVETMAKQAARTVGSTIGRQILRGILGGILGGRK